MRYVCKKCGSTKTFIQEKGSNTGLYCGDCGDCGGWIKWLGKDEVRLYQHENPSKDLTLVTGETKLTKDRCEYCSDYTNKVPSMHKNDSSSWFSLYEHYLEVVIKGESITATTSFKINYCPMCGSNLHR